MIDRKSLALVAGMLIAGTASAQSGPGAGQKSDGGLTGLGGSALGGSALGGVLPGVGSSTMGNAAGVLSYCVKNNILGSSSGAAGVLGKLTGRSDVTGSQDFTLGQQGTLQTGNRPFSLDGVKGQVRTKMCDLVLKHARSFL